MTCDSFHPYTTSWLCKGCGEPAQKHPRFMAYVEEKKRKKEAMQNKTSTQIREETLAVIGKEAAVEGDPDEMIELAPGQTMKRSQFEMLRAVALKLEEDRKTRDKEKVTWTPGADVFMSGGSGMIWD